MILLRRGGAMLVVSKDPGFVSMYRLDFSSYITGL